MAIPARVVRRRIKAIRSTGKIMKAMELVAAAKLRKASQKALAARPYAEALERLWAETLAALPGTDHPFLAGHGTRPDASVRRLVLVAASDRGLCGGFNSRVLKKALGLIADGAGGTAEIATIGRRAEQGIRRAGQTLVASFETVADASSAARTAPIARFACEGFATGRYDEVFVAYTFFKNVLVQEARLLRLLPLAPPAVLDTPAEPATSLFEPSPRGVLAGLVPRVVEQRLYQTLIESSASEQAARMMAMKNAGEAAQDVLQGLTLALNRARQGAITQEISEISAGKAALEPSSAV